MSVSFNSLTVDEILLALPLHHFPATVKRKKPLLLQHLEALNPEDKAVLSSLVVKKDLEKIYKAKQAIEQRDAYWSVPKSGHYVDRHAEFNPDECYHVPTAEELKNCIRDFRNATSTGAVKLSVCGVCARELLEKEEGLEDIPLNAIPHHDRLRPYHNHPSQSLYNGCLLSASGVTVNSGVTYVRMCRTCRKSLQGDRNVPPTLSLANNLWVGNVPWQLEVLTLPEQLLISLVYPRVFVLKLFPKRQQHYVDVNTLQSGMRGNVSTYELNINAVANMLQGKLMPRAPAILASLIAITFIGHGPLPRNWLKKTFTVRRAVVSDALIWLKENNPKYYSDIRIDSTHLLQLPVDDVPEELWNIIRHEPDPAAMADEDSGYVPETENIEGSIDPDVIPLRYLGVQDMDLTKLSSTELMTWGLANLWDKDKEGGYVARHGSRFVRDIGPVHSSSEETSNADSKNLFEQAFPCLYPYGVGGVEAARPVNVPFIEHIRWALQYCGRQFRLHPVFPFYAYGLWIKRQALTSAHVQMHRTTFERHASLLSSITPDDLRQAAEEEKQNVAFTNPAIRLLKKHIHVSSARIIGSDQRRIALRSKIRSTILSLGPPNLWITINPHDIDDPIAQVFAGAKIDMDEFSHLNGPSSSERAKTIAADPYAASKFFHFLINVILNTLFGINVTEYKVTASNGIFGPINSYIGTVESQGRGTLHLHLLLFLKNAPSAMEMESLLKTEEFRKKISGFIGSNIHAYIPGMSTPDEVFSEPIESALAYSRPPDPDKPDFDTRFKEMERKLARAQQVHVCDEKRCLRPDKNGGMQCKRRAPWDTSPEAFINEDGNWGPKRLFPYFTGWSPIILVCNRCNNDIKIITGGSATKALTFYICCYCAKKQGRSYNSSALLADGLLHHFEKPINQYTQNLLERNRLLLFRCLHILNREQELSGPMVMSLIMGWQDIYLSHQYSPIYWTSFVTYLYKVCPDLQQSQNTSFPPSTTTTESQNNLFIENLTVSGTGVEESAPNEDGAELVALHLSSELNLAIKCQVVDYTKRGVELEVYSVLDFFTDTYEECIRKQSKNMDSSAQMQNQSKKGRKRNTRSRYLVGHPKHETYQRVVRSGGHHSLPNIIGRWFPNQKEAEIHHFYCASMLLLLRPWRTIADLKQPDQTWASAYDTFVQNASPQILRIISNIQYYHDCETAASEEISDGKSRTYMPSEFVSAGDEDDLEDDLFPEVNSNPVGQVNVYAADAIHIGRHHKMLISPDISWSGGLREAYPALLHNIQNLYHWKQQLDGASSSHGEAEVSTLCPVNTQTSSEHGGYIIPEELYNMHMTAFAPEEEIAEEALTSVDPSCLLPDQRRAYDIVTWHLNATLEGRVPPQLLMQIQGEGGTGKSKVIQTITDFFVNKNSSALLVKAAYTGIAASLINGKTTHSIGKISLTRGKEMSTESKSWLEHFWKDIKYLILDECSMISREFLAILAKHISIAKGFDDDQEAGLHFGGVNVILCGDFHQFPPVASGKRAPLYYPVHPGHDSVREEMGRRLYEAFETVVILQAQVRVTDPTWRDFLSHLRIGQVKEHHIPMLEELCLTGESCQFTDFTKAPWSEAVLVTPRHSVRTAWNSEMLKKHCHDKNVSLFVAPSEDTINGRPLSVAEKSAVANMKRKKGGLGEINGLAPFVEMAVGMKVMVTANINPDIDIANGSRGEITGIILSPHEKLEEGVQNVIHLKHPPLYILVKLSRTRAVQLDGLEPGVIPILPAKRKVTITMKDSGGKSVKRTITRVQFPITPAYAFTDYRSQGQTLSHVIVDLARPPTGGPLTNFNYYVALSRSSGRETIRLLRDLDKDVLKKSQDNYLQLEDDRLRVLNTKTKEWWAIMSSVRK